jgi:hypothetical protein
VHESGVPASHRMVSARCVSRAAASIATSRGALSSEETKTDEPRGDIDLSDRKDLSVDVFCGVFVAVFVSLKFSPSNGRLRRVFALDGRVCVLVHDGRRRTLVGRVGRLCWRRIDFPSSARGRFLRACPFIARRRSLRTVVSSLASASLRIRACFGMETCRSGRVLVLVLSPRMRRLCRYTMCTR